MEDIATMLTDLITISVPTEVGENPGKTVSKIEEDLESYSKKFELFKSQYKENLQKVDEKLSPQNRGEEYGIRENLVNSEDF